MEWGRVDAAGGGGVGLTTVSSNILQREFLLSRFLLI